MALHPLVGHEQARRRLSRAVRGNKLPQVLLFTGAVGVGKQRLALWLAQLLLCGERGEEPCGRCRACHLVLGLAHPDVHWLVPIPRPKAGDPDKAVDEAAEALGEVLAERRADGRYGPPDGLASHGIASVRLIQRQALLTSVEGGARFFLVGDAERLVPQESSQEAANALLKLLEEPPPRAFFVLTATDARRLLPTIRSRAVPLRLGRLRDGEVRDFLTAHAEPALAGAELDERVRQSGGSIGDALMAGDDRAKARQAAEAVLEAVAEGSGARLERALKQNPWSARGDFTAMLDALAETLGEAARGATGGTMRRGVPPALARKGAEPLLRAAERVAAAREAAWGNVNPQLILAVLGEELAEVL